MNVQPEIPKEEEKPTHRPKRSHLIVAVGYVGENYNGSQIQFGKQATTTKTIEGELARSLIELGYYSHEDIKRMDFERASRTDAKVSAGLALFSLWNANIPTLAEEMNTKLPDDIRVFAMQRTTPRFDVRGMCSARRYEYLVPLRILTFDQTFKQQYDDYQRFIEEMRPQFEFIARPEQFFMPDLKIATKDTSQMTIEELKIHFDTEMLPALNVIGEQFTNRQSYYWNFTSDNKITAISQTGRKYEQFEFTPAFEHEGQLYSKVLILGSAFLYNQIRKMIAAVAMVSRGQCPISWMQRALTGRQEYKTDIPVAPGQYLLLDRQYFRNHDKSQEFKLYGPILSDQQEVLDQAELFKQKIYAQIFTTPASVCDGFLNVLQEMSKETNGYDLAKAAALREVEVGQKIKQQTVSVAVLTSQK